MLFFSDLDKLLGRGEAAHAEGQQDPAACVAALGGALGQLLADLTVDLIPDVKKVPNTGQSYTTQNWWFRVTQDSGNFS